MRKLKIALSVLLLMAGLMTPMSSKAQAMTDEQVQNEMMARFNAMPLQSIHRWRSDGLWIRRNNLPVAYTKQNKMEKQWKLKNGQMSKTTFLFTEDRIGRIEGDTEYTIGTIRKDFDFWQLFIGGTLIGQVYFDGRMFDGKGRPCGRIEGLVDEDMVVFIYFVYSLPD
ncbi:MAG: hypothetical protein IJV45_11435 [Prevotella sp.]|nr:hypothetical protein [Prevotella sp.]